MGFSRQEYSSGLSCPPPGDLLDLGIKSSYPTFQIQVFYIAGGLFTIWTTRESESHSVVSNSLQPHGPYSPWNSSGQNTGVGSLSLLQGIFPTQGLNPGLPHCRQILYQLSHKTSSRILEWVAYPSPADLPNPELEPGSSALQVDSLPTELSRKAEPPGKTLYIVYVEANNLPFNF